MLGKATTRTALGEFIRDLRKGCSLDSGRTPTQEQFQTEVLKYTKKTQYISKIEAGLIKNPDSDFIMLLAEYSGKNADELLRLNQDDAKETVASRKLKLSFGHCLWAAPIYMASKSGDTSFNITSIGQDETPLSASEIIKALEQEDIDVAVIPFDAIPEEDHQFLRLATIVDSSTGCTFICKKEDLEKQHNKPQGTKWLGKFIQSKNNEYKNKGTGVRIFVEENTVSMKYLKDAMTHTIDAHDPTDEVLTEDDVKWSESISKLKNKSFRELEDDCKEDYQAALLGIIAWEPHASWVKRNSTDVELIKIPLHFEPRDKLREKRLTFDVIVRSKIEQDVERFRKLRIELWELILELRRCVTKINKWQFISDALSDLKAIAEYFDLLDTNENEKAALKDILEELKKINFRVTCDPLALEQFYFITDEVNKR